MTGENTFVGSGKDWSTPHPADDWQVVEEALACGNNHSMTDAEVKAWFAAPAALARLREREQTLEDNRTTWMYRAEAAEAHVARLEEALRKMRQWDVLDVTADGPYWKSVLDSALAHEEEKQYPPLREGGPMMPSVAHEEEARPPAPDPALVSWQGLRGTKHPKDMPSVAHEEEK